MTPRRRIIRKLNTAVRIAHKTVRRGPTDFVDITEADRLGLDEVFTGARRVGRTLLWASSGSTPARSMLWPSPVEAIQAPHADAPAAADVDLYFVRDAVVGGMGSHLTLDGRLVFAQGPYPNYVKHWFEQRIDRAAWTIREPVTREIETAFVILHFNFVWGHWLTEMYPKAFMIEALHKLGLTAPILVPTTAPRYVTDVLRWTLPDHEIIIYDPRLESVRVKLALLPHMLHREYAFHEVLNARLDRQAQAAAQGPARRLFVSRAALDQEHAFRLMANREEIEGIAAELGFELFSPETHSWGEQVAAFSNASVVAGEFGSGLHNALLSPAGTKVMALNWIVDVQSRIANFRRQDVGYLLDPDGAPRVFSLDRRLEGFSIDPAEFRGKAQLVLDLADRRPPPRYEDIQILTPTRVGGR